MNVHFWFADPVHVCKMTAAASLFAEAVRHFSKTDSKLSNELGLETGGLTVVNLRLKQQLSNEPSSRKLEKKVTANDQHTQASAR